MVAFGMLGRRSNRTFPTKSNKVVDVRLAYKKLRVHKNEVDIWKLI